MRYQAARHSAGIRLTWNKCQCDDGHCDGAMRSGRASVMVGIYADQRFSSRTASRLYRAASSAHNHAYCVAYYHAATAPAVSRMYAHTTEQPEARGATPAITHWMTRLTRASSRRSQRLHRRPKSRVSRRAALRRSVRPGCRVTPRPAYALNCAPVPRWAEPLSTPCVSRIAGREATPSNARAVTREHAPESGRYTGRDHPR